jgi:hypothetical protein
MLSVEAVHARLICEAETADADRPAGVDGDIVSDGPLPAALNAAICMTQNEPLWVPVAGNEPVVVTFLSSVTLPNDVDRLVKPAPPEMALVEAPAPKIRSVGFVVDGDPLLAAAPVPAAAAATSSGDVVSRPEYSWM